MKLTETVFFPEYGMEYKIPSSWVAIVDHWRQDVHPTSVSFESEHFDGNSREWFEHCCEQEGQDMGEEDFAFGDKPLQKEDTVYLYDRSEEDLLIIHLRYEGQRQFLMSLMKEAVRVGMQLESLTPLVFRA